MKNSSLNDLDPHATLPIWGKISANAFPFRFYQAEPTSTRFREYAKIAFTSDLHLYVKYTMKNKKCRLKRRRFDRLGMRLVLNSKISQKNGQRTETNSETILFSVSGNHVMITAGESTKLIKERREER